jgi:hypothetical protein
MPSHDATRVAAADRSTPAITLVGAARRRSPLALITCATAPTNAHNQPMLAHERFVRAACADCRFVDRPGDIADTVSAAVTVALGQFAPVANVDSVPEVPH